jgi:Asp-tRNA(Asn)/Glu-tRNA(Gln) amidotransferase A subunit family amidase
MEARADERLRAAVFDAIQDAFDGYDFLVSPTLAVAASAAFEAIAPWSSLYPDREGTTNA